MWTGIIWCQIHHCCHHCHYCYHCHHSYHCNHCHHCHRCHHCHHCCTCPLSSRSQLTCHHYTLPPLSPLSPGLWPVAIITTVTTVPTVTTVTTVTTITADHSPLSSLCTLWPVTTSPSLSPLHNCAIFTLVKRKVVLLCFCFFFSWNDSLPWISFRIWLAKHFCLIYQTIVVLTFGRSKLHLHFGIAILLVQYLVMDLPVWRSLTNVIKSRITIPMWEFMTYRLELRSVDHIYLKSMNMKFFPSSSEKVWYSISDWIYDIMLNGIVFVSCLSL
jgi:hypothetical protein